MDSSWMIEDLKNIARNHDCFVLALAHLQRQVDMREDRHPVLEDIGHSGFDDVYFIYRDKYYEGWNDDPWEDYIDKRLSSDPEEEEPEEAELIIAKSLVLETRTVPLLFDPNRIMFELFPVCRK